MTQKKPVIVKQTSNGSFKLGLEKEGLSMFEQTSTSFEIPYVNGKFDHGLTEEQVDRVEKHYGLSFEDPEHRGEWLQIVLSYDHTINAYDLESNPEHLLAVSVMKNMGQAAPNLEEASNPMANYKMVIYNDGDEEEMKATYLERLDTAIMDLQEMKKTKGQQQLIYTAKYILPQSAGIGNDPAKAYVKLRSYLDGNMTSTKDEALVLFNSAINKGKDIIYTTVDFREAYKMNIIRKNNKGQYYNVMSTTVYGSTEEQAIEYLLNPKNQEELGMGKKADANYSIRQQLKNR